MVTYLLVVGAGFIFMQILNRWRSAEAKQLRDTDSAGSLRAVLKEPPNKLDSEA
jgi:hypothetical protein